METLQQPVNRLLKKKSDEKKYVVGLKVRLTKWSVLVEVQTVYVPSCPFDEMTL